RAVRGREIWSGPCNSVRAENAPSWPGSTQSVRAATVRDGADRPGGSMKIAVLGASGTIGRRIAREALERGHTVTGIARHPSRIDTAVRLRPVQADATKADELARAIEGHDAVISAIGPAPGEPASV